MRIPGILAISLAAVLAGSLLLVSPFSINDFIIPKQSTQVQQAEAQALPLVIRDRFTEMRLAGDAAAGSRFLKVDENFVDPENHCEFCTRVEYTPGPRGVAGFAYEDLTGLDLSNARKVQFWVMGDEGEERIKFKLAGKSLDRIQDRIQDRLGRLSDRLASEGIFTTERFALTTQEVTLDNTWQKYEVDLTGTDLRDITHPFAFELSEDGDDTQIVYIKGIIYDDEPAEDPLVAVTAEELAADSLAAEVISNGTEGVAPATFEFKANVTGSTEPYSIGWNFGDGSSEEGENVIHTFEEAGEYNVTLEVEDAGGQNASSSISIQITEPEVTEEEIVDESANETLTDANATDALEETDSLEDIPDEQNATDDQVAAEPIEIQVDAGMDIVAQSEDTIVLAGDITGIDAESEGLTVEWTQTSGPSVEIEGGDSLNPTIVIPELDDDAEVEIELAASLESAEESDTVTVFVQDVEDEEDALEESLTPVESAITEWSSECDDQADCMSDDSDDTIAASQDTGSINLFAFNEFDVENADIAYVTAVVTARASETGYLLFVGADTDDPDDLSEPDGAVSIASSSFEEYEFVWEENPVTGSPWTAESLNSFLSGYVYGGGQSDIEVSEFELIVTYTAEELTEPEPETEELVPEENLEQIPEQTEESAANETGE